MKKIILMACLLLPVIVTAQQALTNQYEGYVEVWRMTTMNKSKITIHQGEQQEAIKDDRGKEWSAELVEVLNYMDTQGFDFICFIEVEKKTSAAVQDRILFRRRK